METGFFDIVTGLLQGNTLTLYLFIICLDYVLWTSLHWMKENGFTLEKVRGRRYPTRMIMDADYADNIALVANTPAQAQFLLHSLEWAAGGISLHVNADKTEFMYFNQRGNISTLNGRSLKLVDKVTYLGTNVNRLSVIWKSDLSDEIKHSFSQVAFILILLFGCTTWTLTKHMERKLDSNCTRMLRAVLNKSCWQHPTKQQLYGHRPLISKTIQIRWARYMGHCWRSKGKLISNVVLWTLSQR